MQKGLCRRLAKIIKLATQQIADRKRKKRECEQDKSKRVCHHQDYEPSRLGVWPFSYNPVNKDWQHDMCAVMGLRFICANDVSPQSHLVALILL